MKDITLMKMPHDVLGRIKYITSREKSIKGLIFGDRHNDDIADNVIPGVLVVEDENEIQHNYNLQIDDDPAIDAESVDDNEEIDELDEYEVEQSDADDSVAESTGVDPENADDEVPPPDFDGEAGKAHIWSRDVVFIIMA